MPKKIRFCLILNVITLVIFIFTSGTDLVIFKKLFMFSLVLTVLSLAFINIQTSWKVAKDFYSRRQYILLLGQIIIAVAIIAIAGCMIFYLLTAL